MRVAVGTGSPRVRAQAQAAEGMVRLLAAVATVVRLRAEVVATVLRLRAAVATVLRPREAAEASVPRLRVVVAGGNRLRVVPRAAAVSHRLRKGCRLGFSPRREVQSTST